MTDEKKRVEESPLIQATAARKEGKSQTGEVERKEERIDLSGS
jgi:hypothetical protein